MVSAQVFSRRTRSAWTALCLSLGCATGTTPPATSAPAVVPAALAASPTAASDYKVIGYFTNWVEARKGCEFRAKDVDASAFTHINFAFAEVDAGPGGKQKPRWGLAPFGAAAKSRDLGPKGLYAELNALKGVNPNLKTLLSVGGWAHTDPPMAWLFTTMAETQASRGEFIENSHSSTFATTASTARHRLGVPCRSDARRAPLRHQELHAPHEGVQGGDRRRSERDPQGAAAPHDGHARG